MAQIAVLVLSDGAGSPPSAPTAWELLTSQPLMRYICAHYNLVRYDVAGELPELNQATDLVIVDGRTRLNAARRLCQQLAEAGTWPILLVLRAEGLAALSPDWGIDDLVVDTGEPAEFETRIRLLLATGSQLGSIRAGPVEIDAAGYTAQVAGRALNLTYTEFELLKYLACHPGRVLTREHLLSQVWGYNYYGGTRTVDVHIRRLRAKLGAEFAPFIATVRNVGYRFEASHR